MNEKDIFLSICIPSYNRPNELERLLESIDIKKYVNEIEIIINENHSPKRYDSRKKVVSYSQNHNYDVKFFVNRDNYGYDRNLRIVASRAKGCYVMFMSDDDQFIPDALDQFITFLKQNQDVCYVLRRYQTINKLGEKEEFRYASHSVKFKEGEKAVVELYRRSVFLSGLTFKKECFRQFNISKFDGTLLFQLYIQSTICLSHTSCYCDIPLVFCNMDGIPCFGDSYNEKKLYSYGKNTISSSLNFLHKSQNLIKIFDEMNNTNLCPKIIKTYSKYSYGFLKEHRNDGIRNFFRYTWKLIKMGYGCSLYFYIYFIGLLFLGTDNCQNIIRKMKDKLGQTPNL